MRAVSLFVPIFLIASLVSAQSTAKDSEGLQALVQEIRHLRQDLVTSTVAGQRVQIVLYRLQGQQAAVQRAVQRRDLTRDRLSDTESQIGTKTADLQRVEDYLGRTQSQTEIKEMQEQEVPRLKSDVERLHQLVEQQQTELAQAEEQARSEQAKLSDLENFLDKLDKSLAELDHASTR